MRWFVPTTDENGLASEVSEHFGSAPVFAVLDDLEGKPEFESTPARHGGGCGGWRQLGLMTGDVVACRHIGSGALNGLTAAGVRVLRTRERELAGVLRALADGTLEPFDLEEVHRCGGSHH